MAKKILIADDSQFMREMLKGILSAEGYEISEAADGTEALQHYKEKKPDLILLDLIMPEVDGLAVLKQIGKTAKIVVVSAVGQEKILAEAKELGAFDYIVKPFDNTQVLEMVKKILG